ncbi:hypothetical protein ACBI99_14640 [Nonomuraea sp. ATR24]|uniref:hypothetical protein n=1 Tax=Nonomuraea TaxID=83681 RepID=UPI001C5EAFB6|nr:hypothetical protein [Nonomuraea ceibae]
MTYTEDELRDLLAELTAYVPGRTVDVTRIVRRGRRMLLVRRREGPPHVPRGGAAA